MSLDELAGRWPKSCSQCDASWSAENWRELPLTSRAVLSNRSSIELRRCRCGEIIAAAVSDDGSR